MPRQYQFRRPGRDMRSIDTKGRKPLMARVIIDSSGSYVSLPHTEARKLYAAGKLSYDTVRGAYCRTVEDERANRIPEFLMEESLT